jgi:biotin carboxyl carrier protein
VIFEVELNGRMHRVSVDRSRPGRFHVSLDGVAHDVDAVRVGEYGISLLLDGNDDRSSSRELQVVPSGAVAELLVDLEGRTVPVSVNARRTRRRAADAAVHADGEQAIAAPMPGRVVRVLVAEGDQVAARQAVIVVEAMKMENELRSPKAGRVTHVAVTAGMSVEGGRVLIVIE